MKTLLILAMTGFVAWSAYGVAELAVVAQNAQMAHNMSVAGVE